jgi:tetratricopeptide (TPR) repeat protein
VRIFISYRHADTEAEAGRLKQSLAQHLPADDIFLDTSSLKPGEIWPDALDRHLDDAVVVLVLIGPKWLGAHDTDGRRRLDLHDDWVRTEISRALDAGKEVVPVLIRTDSMPTQAQLPPSLSRVPARQAVELRARAWDRDVENLVGRLHATIQGPGGSHRPATRQGTTQGARERGWRAGAPLRRPEPFIGRDTEVADTVRLLRDASGRSVAILGPPGIGKSALCLATLDEPDTARYFGSRRWFVRCDGTTDADTLLAAIAAELGITATGVPLLPPLIEFLASGPALLALDNLESPLARAEAGPDVEDLLGSLARPGVVILATIRAGQVPLRRSWHPPITLQRLGKGYAEALFHEITFARFTADPDLDTLLGKADRVPLAVELLGYVAQTEAHLAGLVRRYEAESVKMLERHGGRTSATSVSVSVEVSLQDPRMTPHALRLLCMLSRLPDGVAHSQLEALLPDVGLRSASDLKSLALASEKSGRLRTLGPVRDYIRDHFVPRATDPESADSSQPPPSLIAADLRRLATHYCAIAVAQGERIFTTDGHAATLVLTREVGNLTSSISLALEHDLVDQAVAAAQGLAKCMQLTGPKVEGLLEKALADVQALGSTRPRVSSLRQAELAESLALVKSRTYRDREARDLFEYARGEYRQVAAVPGAEAREAREREASCLRNLAELDRNRFGDPRSAESNYRAAQRIFRELDGGTTGASWAGQAGCLWGRAELARTRPSDYVDDASRLEKARRLLRRAERLFHRVGDAAGEGNCHWAMGEVARQRSDSDTATACFADALRLYRSVDFALGEAHAWRSLGLLERERGNAHESRELLERALELFTLVGDREGRKECLRELGEAAPDDPGVLR